MNRKLSLLITSAFLQGFLGTAHANTPQTSHGHQKEVQFFVGLLGGIEQMRGRESDIFVATGAPAENRTFASNAAFPLSDKGAVFTGFSGFFWNIPTTPVSIGPEIYIGQGDRESTLRNTYFEPAAIEQRIYTSAIRRKSFYGVALRGGVNFCQDYLAHVSIGVDYGKFSITRSFQKDTSLPDTNTSTVSTSRSFPGLLLGIGLEKKMGCFKLGVDFKTVRYRKKSFSDIIPTSNGTPGSMILGYTAQPRIYSVAIRFTYLL